MTYRFPQVNWLAIYFQNISQVPRIVQIIMISGRHRASKGLNQRGAKRCQDCWFVCPSRIVYHLLCSILLSPAQQTAKSQAYLPSHLFAGAACLPLESDWPLAVDWNWLHKGYNNERLLIFWQWYWSVKGWDTAVTRTTRFYINVLSSSQIPKIRLGLWSQRYCVSNWVVLIHPALAHDCTVMMNVSLLCWMKSWSNEPNIASSSAGLSECGTRFWTFREEWNL